MANFESISDLEAVDFAFGSVIGDCFKNLAPEGPTAFQRFVKRKAKDKIFLAQNSDVQALLRRYAKRVDDKGKTPPDLPIVAYYRSFDIVGDTNQHTQVWEVTRFKNEAFVNGPDEAMRITTMPLALTYSMLFLTWDRPTLDKMCLAWWGYIVPLFRKHSRFMAKYLLDGDEVDVPCNISTPREILTSSEDVDTGDGKRLWGARTQVEITTQALYGARVEVADTLDVVGVFEVLP